MNDEEIKVSELDSVSEIRDTDQIMIVQGGANKKISGSYINEHGVNVSSITPDTSQRVWFKKSKNLFSSLLELGTFTNEGVKSNSTTNYRNATPIQVQPNTTYTISINGVSQKYAVYYYNNTNTFIESEGLTTGTFTTPANCYYINFRCFNADFTSDYANLKLQIEKGDTATSYEPYITPSIIVDNTEFYSQEYINKFTKYSTTEQVVGKWINGKPVYRKVVDYYPTEIIGAGGTTTNIQVPHNISNFGQIINCRVVTETNHVFPTLASSTGSTLTAGNAVIQVNSTNIIFRIINDSWSSRHFYFILEYTKTTD